jgi:hypothetical protein
MLLQGLELSGFS